MRVVSLYDESIYVLIFLSIETNPPPFCPAQIMTELRSDTTGQAAHFEVTQDDNIACAKKNGSFINGTAASARRLLFTP